MVSATDTDVLDETLEDDESPDEGFAASTEETDSQQPDPVAELRAELAALKQSYAGLDPARITSELGRVRSLQSDIDRLKNAPAPQRDTLADEAIESLASVLVASPLVDDDAKASVRSLLGRLSEAKTKNEREALRREITDEVKQAVAPARAETAPDPEAAAATARVFDFADGLGIAQDAAIAVLDGKWTLQPGETLEGAIARLKGVLKEHVQTQTSNARVSERKQAAGSGSPQRTGAASYSNIDDAEDDYLSGKLSQEEYRKVRKSFGVG